MFFPCRSTLVLMETPRSRTTTLPGLSLAAGINADIAIFEPFAETFLCPGCERPLSLYVQPLHLTERINCPRCGRPLSAQIRRAIFNRRQG